MQVYKIKLKMYSWYNQAFAQESPELYPHGRVGSQQESARQLVESSGGQ